jgi:hypothetical protein
MDMTNTLLELEHRPVELGRIRLGAKATTKGGKEYPTTLDTWRLTSAQRGYLDAAAGLYGGEVVPWPDAPDEGYWQLVTTVSELRVLIPTSLRTVSQAYELWQGGTCERRCDGTTEQFTGGPCLCDPAARECELMTRISIMLPDVPGLGVWRLDTGGWHAATSLPATIELLKSLSSQPWIPAILRLEQRSRKVRDNGQVVTHRFAVPVLDLPGMTIGKVIARMGNAEVPQIEPMRTTQPTAAERAIARAAAITNGDDGAPPPSPPAGARAVTPSAGSTRAGNPEPASPTAVAASADSQPEGASAEVSPAPTPHQDAPKEAIGASTCNATPPADHPLGMTAPCELRGEHKAHRSAEGSWPR